MGAKPPKIWAYLSSYNSDVTGSNTLVKICWDGGRTVQFIVDCGIFQGGSAFDEYSLNCRPFEYDVKQLDFALLTHFHADHSCRFPWLYKNGYTGKIYTTQQTALISKIILDDSLSRADTDFWMAQNIGRKKEDTADVKLVKMYDIESVDRTLASMQYVEYSKPFRPVEDLEITFCPNGHCLGASCILVRAISSHETLTILFTGDIAQVNKVTGLKTYIPPAWRNWVDVIVSESTYGAAPLMCDTTSEQEKHLEILRRAMRENRRVVYVVNALERPEVVMCDLKQIMDNNLLGEDTAKLRQTPIYLDSFMANCGLELYNDLLKEYVKYVKPSFINKLERESIWNMPGRKKIFFVTSPQFYRGTIVNYMDKIMSNPYVDVVFCSYVNEGVKNIINAPKDVKIMYMDVTYQKKCKMYQLTHYSAHACMFELGNFLNSFHNVKSILFQHGSTVARENAVSLFKTEDRQAYAFTQGLTIRINRYGVTKIY